MVSRRYSVALFWRLALIFAWLAAAAWLGFAAGRPWLALVPGAIALALLAEVLAFVRRANRALVQVLDALRHEDATQAMVIREHGSGFDALRETVDDILHRFRERRARQEERLRYLEAVVNHVPVPLLVQQEGDRIALLNNAARRFFAAHRITRSSDFDAFGPELRSAMAAMRPGEQRLVRLAGEDLPQRVVLSVAEIVAGGPRKRLIAIHNIASELEATETEAWQQLVHVLTHEIMNSLTPVASLSATAAGLLAEPDPDHEALADARHALETVARRAEALMRFVESYRQLARLPQPRRQVLAIADLFARLETLTAAECAAAGVALVSEVVPSNLEIRADAELIEQVLINLCRNALDALEGRPNGVIRLSAHLNRHGRAVIAVADNGPGVPAEIADRIFVPFFTTRPGGTGVGLALTRQVMIAHEGSVALGRSDGGGALFTLTF